MQLSLSQDKTISGPAAKEARQSAEQRPPLRIVHIVSSLKVGGMEHFVLRIAAVQSAYHKVSIVALHDGPLRQEARKLGLPVYVMGGSQKHLRALRGALTLRWLRPQVAHAHNQTSLHYAVLAKRVGKAKVVMTNHGQGLGSPRTPTSTEWGHTDRVIAVSRAVAERLQAPEISDKISVILNGIETRLPQRTRQEIRAALGIGDEVVGLMVARIDGFKGHDTLIKALGRVKEQGVRLTVLIAGDGAERENMEKLAGGLGLTEEHIRFLGFRSDVPDLLGASDLFLLPSVTEGLPLSVLEAMSAGKPVIATPVGGIPELVESGKQGLLTPVGDDNALAGAIMTLVSDEDQRARLGQAGLERVNREFTFAQMTERYEELYAGLVG